MLMVLNSNDSELTIMLLFYFSISEMGKKRLYSPLEFDASIKMSKPSTVSSDKRFILVKVSEENYSFGK